MKRRIIAIAFVLCLICAVLVGCSKNITADEACQVVYDDLGISAVQAGHPHVHEGTFGDIPCYNIYITVGETNWFYSVTTEGEIVNIAEIDEEHSH